MKKLFALLLSVYPSLFAIAQNNFIDSLKQELALLKEDSTKVELLSYLSMAYSYSYADTGLAYAQQALDLAEKLNYKHGISLSMGNMVGALTTLGNYPLALDYGFRELALFTELRDTVFIIYSYNGIAEV